MKMMWWKIIQQYNVWFTFCEECKLSDKKKVDF